MNLAVVVEPRELEGDLLLAIARGAVAERFGAEAMQIPARPWLTKLGATFVTIELGDRLHGCIGSVEPRLPLVEDLRHNAVMAAFHDPRTRPLRAEELELVRFSVSVLGPRSPIVFNDREDALSQLRPHVDGVILTHGHHRGLFLPQVWDTLPDRATFLAQLARKAGLPPGSWADDFVLERFEVTKFGEELPPTARSKGWHH